MTNRSRISRLVLDESHQFLTAVKYREHFPKIIELAKRAIQRVFLTGSLPRKFERPLLSVLGLSPSTKFIRAMTDQPHIGHHVIAFESKKYTSAAVAANVVSFLNKRWLKPEERGIIYCSSKAKVESLALLVPDSTSSHSTMIERGENERAWLDGTKKWMIATSGFIHGIDAKRVAAVIILDDGHREAEGTCGRRGGGKHEDQGDSTDEGCETQEKSRNSQVQNAGSW